MKAVWSFWSKPFGQRQHGWKRERHHLLSWVLSVQTARKHFPSTALYTDDAGKEMLVEGIGLEFDEVSTCLNDLDGNRADWWALGKVYTYSLQDEPFVHIDSDVYLWDPLPGRLTGADVLVQNPEAFPVGRGFYRPEQLTAAVRAVGGWLPQEWMAYGPRGGMQHAFCCGILGGCHTVFLRHYAKTALRLMEEPANQTAWPMISDRSAINCLFEQYFLAACVQYGRLHEDSACGEVRVECFFRDLDDAYRHAEQMGFTHLLGGSKQNPSILARLERRIRNDYPEYYERCMSYGDRAEKGESPYIPFGRLSA